MKREKSARGDYAQLRLKLFLRLAGIAVLAFAAIFAFYEFVWYLNGGEWFVSFCQRYLHLDESSAILLYGRLFRNHEGAIWLGATLVMFLLLFLFVLRWFTGCLERVNRGVDDLLREGAELRLPNELAATERRLRAVKGELERRGLEAKLAEQRKDELVIYLAHDIRTPLTSVIGYLELLSESPDLNVEQRAKCVGIALDKAYRLERMIGEFFEITRYNLQQMELKRKRVDLYMLLMQLSDELTPLLAERGNRVELDAPEELSVLGDADKLARLFNNLLRNAAAYSFPGTPVRIAARALQAQVEVRVENRGPDIPPEKLTAIFKKFYRLDEARGSNTGGAGLGLAIAREIVRLHGGTIRASSADERVTFTVTLPIDPSAKLMPGCGEA